MDRATGAEGAAQVTITPGDKPASAKLSGGGTRAMLPACFSREIVPTSARWASVGTYSAGILRFQSLNQGTRARYTKNGDSAEDGSQWGALKRGRD